jgi:hypothetical protein
LLSVPDIKAKSVPYSAKEEYFNFEEAFLIGQIELEPCESVHTDRSASPPLHRGNHLARFIVLGDFNDNRSPNTITYDHSVVSSEI